MENLDQGGLGNWLKETCQRERLSLRQAATKTGLSHATIAQLMKRGSASPETIMKLATAFGGNGKQRWAMEDKLLVLAGYRTERPDREELSEPQARLLDKLDKLREPELKVLSHFADFVAELCANREDIPSIRLCNKLAEYSGVSPEQILSTAGYLPRLAEMAPPQWPEFREYASQKYPDDLDEDLITMIEDLIERRRARRYDIKDS
jgi:transcriptional regulator with XRE-family HTH domain